MYFMEQSECGQGPEYTEGSRRQRTQEARAPNRLSPWRLLDLGDGRTEGEEAT